MDDVDIVFNYDLPQDEEYYVHRIGRTGRAGREGLALTFISGKEVYKLKDIEHYCKTKIKAKPIPSLDDVKNTKLEVLFEKIKETIAEGGISDMIEMVENHVNDEDYTSMDMAAALLKMVIADSLDEMMMWKKSILICMRTITAWYVCLSMWVRKIKSSQPIF